MSIMILYLSTQLVEKHPTTQTLDYKTDPSEMIDEPAHNIGWHDNQPEVKPVTLANEEEEMCDACAI